MGIIICKTAAAQIRAVVRREINTSGRVDSEMAKGLHKFAVDDVAYHRHEGEPFAFTPPANGPRREVVL